MKAIIRLSGDKDGRHSTEASIEVLQEWDRVRLTADANWRVDYFSMRASEARVLAAALLEAAGLAERAPDLSHRATEIKT